MFVFVMLVCLCLFFFFFFNDTATTEIYTLSLHDALPIPRRELNRRVVPQRLLDERSDRHKPVPRSEEHTSELQSRRDLVCRLLLEKKKKQVKRRLQCQKKKKKFNTPIASVTVLTLTSTGNIRFFFFFNETATTEIYTLSLHDALPIQAQAGA